MKLQLARKSIILCFVSFLLAAISINVNDVLADVAPPEPPSGTNPMPGEELTNVRMVAETVFVEIDADSPYDEGLASVTATFTMRNLGNVDEQLEVRFPLDQTLGWGGLCSDPFPQFSPITDLKVQVNGQFVSTQKTYQTITLPTVDEPHPTITIPCWEHFTVSFPVGKDVTIQVLYTTEPYHGADASYAYAYVLETGTGWKDTIGTADITFKVPYELNNSNFYACWPEECLLNGNQIQWHYEDFEPTANLGIHLLPPPLWQSIVLEKKNTTRNPNDGEAWGRLAKAYKESIMQRRGFRAEPEAIESYRLSVEAYRQAITLLPDDADWHYGFAELLCWNAEWNNFLVDSTEAAWRSCVEQIQQTINVNPKHEKANELLAYVASLGMIDTNGPQPDYLILTPQPTVTATPVKTQIPTDNSMILTKTSEGAQATKNPTPIPSQIVSPTAEPAADLSVRNTGVPLFLALLTSLFAASFVIARLRKG